MSASHLNRAAAHAMATLEACGNAWGAAVGAGRQDLADHIDEATQAARRTVGALQEAGARFPEEAHTPTVAPFSLSDLAAVERIRGEAKELAAGLRALLPLAERIDAARGRALAEPVAGSAGLDLAEDLAQLLARVDLDLYGPAATVTGGRE